VVNDSVAARWLCTYALEFRAFSRVSQNKKCRSSNLGGICKSFIAQAAEMYLVVQ